MAYVIKQSNDYRCDRSPTNLYRITAVKKISFKTFKRIPY